jgi:hypothetical protein
MEKKESEIVAVDMRRFIELVAIPGIIQCDKGTEFNGACDRLVTHHGILVVLSKPSAPQTNGLIDHANGVLKSNILACITETESTGWWLALQQAMLSMNLQVHATTGMSPYGILFKQLMPDRPRISTAQRSTAVVIDKCCDIQGLPIASTGLDPVPDSRIDLQLLEPICVQRESLM